MLLLKRAVFGFLFSVKIKDKIRVQGRFGVFRIPGKIKKKDEGPLAETENSKQETETSYYQGSTAIHPLAAGA